MTSIAIDIGASGGKVIALDIIDGKYNTREIYRFGNAIEMRDNQMVWNIENLFHEILNGLKMAKREGITECSIGICTWGVDYVMLDKNDHIIGNAVAYRDRRTDGVIQKVTKIMPKKLIYEKTGIQFLQFNTLYQLFATPNDQKAKCKKILLIPDYFYFRLTGKKINEITNMSTGQLLY